MKIIPFEKIELHSPLSKEELVIKLNAAVRPLSIIPSIFRTEDSAVVFAGKVKEESFSIQRIINYRNSFVPIVKGKLINVKGGTEIRLTLRLHLWVMLFMIHWCTAVFSVCVMTGNDIITEGFQLVLMIPFLMLLFAILMVGYGFNKESKTTKKQLKEILEGKEINN